MDVISAILRRDFANDNWLAWTPTLTVILVVGMFAIYGVASVERWRRGERADGLEMLFWGLSFMLFSLPQSLYLLNLLPPNARGAVLGLVACCLLLGAIVEWRRWRRAATSRQRTQAVIMYAVFTALLLLSAFHMIAPGTMGMPL